MIFFKCVDKSQGDENKCKAHEDLNFKSDINYFGFLLLYWKRFLHNMSVPLVTVLVY